MKKVLCFLFFCMVVSITVSAQALDVYLKAMGPSTGTFSGLIKGNSTDRGHENEIQVLSYSTGVVGCSPNASKNGANACKTSVGNLYFMMQFAEGINPLRHFVLTGIKLPTADFVFEKAAGDGAAVIYKIHMEDITVVSLQESGSSEMPMFSVEFSATRIAWAVYKQTASGNSVLASSMGYNLATNSSWTYSF